MVEVHKLCLLVVLLLQLMVSKIESLHSLCRMMQTRPLVFAWRTPYLPTFSTLFHCATNLVLASGNSNIRYSNTRSGGKVYIHKVMVPVLGQHLLIISFSWIRHYSYCACAYQDACLAVLYSVCSVLVWAWFSLQYSLFKAKRCSTITYFVCSGTKHLFPGPLRI